MTNDREEETDRDETIYQHTAVIKMGVACSKLKNSPVQWALRHDRHADLLE